MAEHTFPSFKLYAYEKKMFKLPWNKLVKLKNGLYSDNPP